MKKLKLFAFFGLALSLLFASGLSNKPIRQVRAEEITDSSEVVDEPTDSEIVVESFEEPCEIEEKEDDPSVFEEISQTAKDTIAVVKEFLSQPIVIGGITTTLGAIILSIISKLLGNAKKGEITDLGKKITNLANELAKEKKVTKETLDKFVTMYDLLVVMKDSIKNIELKENAEKLLNELKPVKEHAETYVKEESKLVVSDTKQEINADAKSVLDILNRD